MYCLKCKKHVELPMSKVRVETTSFKSKKGLDVMRNAYKGECECKGKLSKFTTGNPGKADKAEKAEKKDESVGPR